MNPTELSILSDDLRPRDTPNHTLLKDFAVKPMVPDLSITEGPSNEDPVFNNRCQQPASSQENSPYGVLNRPKALVEECKTYSEWRKKSAQNVKTQAAGYPGHEHSHIHYVNGVSSPTVLDNLNSSVALQRYGDHSAAFQNGRLHMGHNKDSQMNGTSLKVSHIAPNSNFPRTASQKNWGPASVPMNSQRRESSSLGTQEPSPRQDSHSENGHRKCYSRNATDSNSSHSSRQFLGNQGQIPNCVNCVHWPHQVSPAINCNSAPCMHSCTNHFGGMPPCNAMPGKPGSILPTVRAEQSPKETRLSRHSGAFSSHSFHDSVVYDNLYQIVLSQSEQLKTLQAQVEKILISQENYRCSGRTEQGCQTRPGFNVVERGTQTSDGEPDRGDNGKVSVEVMTSLIRTVAYSGRMELVDSRNKGFNQPVKSIPIEVKNKTKDGCSQSTSTSSLQALPTSSPFFRGDMRSSPPTETLDKCCKCDTCSDMEKRNQRKKKASKHQKITQMDQLAETLGRTGPGVSTAIRTVRGCQAALENESLPNGCDVARSGLGTGVDESITLNNKAELPSIDLPVSPPSSVHLEIQAYQGSSSDSERSSSDHEDCSSYESDTEGSDCQAQRPNGWNMNRNIPVLDNPHLENGDEFGGDLSPGKRHSRKARTHQENCPPRSAANGGLVNSVLKRVAFQQEPKSSEDDSEDSLKRASLQYLRDNYPEELASSGGFRPGQKSSVSHKRYEDLALLNVGNNMSFATYRYLHRYNLLPEGHSMEFDEELAGYDDDMRPSNAANKAALTNNSPNRGYRGYALASRVEQHVNAGQYGMRTGNARDFLSKENARRPHLREKHNQAHVELLNGRKQPSKGHGHKRHMAQTHGPYSNAQQRATKVLDVTALHQQDTLQWNKSDDRV